MTFPSNNDTVTSTTRPRIRFGTITWGLLTLGAGAALLTALGTPGQRDQLVTRVFSMTPADAILVSTIVFGAIVLLLGLLAVIRSRQKRSPRE